MYKKIYSIILLLAPLFLSTAYSQQFDVGNSWYKNISNQPFIRLVVEEDGVYRVSAQDFTSRGFDLTNVDPRKLRLFYRGQEVPIHVSTSAGSLRFIEFFGKRNDGAIDSIMYRAPINGIHQPNLQPNKNLSLYSDESVYFLTWGGSNGRRYIDFFNPTYSLFTKQAFFRYTSRVEYEYGNPLTKQVRGGGGQYDSFYTLNSDYVTGEGYTGPLFSYGPNRSYVVQIPTPDPANFLNRSMAVKARVFGRSNTPHHFRLELNGDADNEIVDTTFTSSKIYINTYQRDHIATLTDTSDLEFFALKAETDNNNICWSSITYDRLPNMRGESQIKISEFRSLTDAYFDFDNADGVDSIYVYDSKNPFRIKGLMVGQNARVIIPQSNKTRELYLVTDKGFKTPRIESSSLNSLFDPSQGAEYVIITNRSLAASANAMANYRDTATVTRLNKTKVVYTDQIYDEYGYGTLTPWAIKRFCKDAIDNWDIKPEYFLLWGKGQNLPRDTIYRETLVPSFGYPATDYEFISHFDQNSVSINPLAAIGRVNVLSNQQGMEYLDKVNEYEHTPWQSWMKKGIFLGGGGSIGEQSAIADAFGFYIDKFEGIPYGGDVTYFQKRSSTTLDQRQNASYHDQISAGSSIIHFFGHSTSNIQDVTLKEPFEYNNLGRYPMMIAMGCFGGDFTSNISFGENWVSSKGRGSIAYIGGSSAGYLTPLRDYGRVFYNTLFTKLESTTIGKAFQETVKDYTDTFIGIQPRNHARQMNLQGDPAVRLYFPQKPDLEVTGPNVFFEGGTFTAQDDSAILNIIIQNKARAVNDSVLLTVKQRTPDGNVITHVSEKLAATSNRDTLVYTIYNKLGNAITGTNNFEVFIDAENVLGEFDETNNLVNYELIVPGNIPAILYPSEFAVVGESQVHLDASAFFITNTKDVGYYYEIDTVFDFSSNAKISSPLIQGSANYATWEPPLTLENDRVYYWRVRLANVSPSIWGTSSFKYIENRTGWAQADIPQFIKNPANRIKADVLQDEWQFENFEATYSFSTQQNGNFEYSVNGALGANTSANGFFDDAVVYMILDQYSLESALNLGQFDALYRIVPSPSRLTSLKNAILNAEHGDYFIIGSNRSPQLDAWGDDLFEALELIGASQNLRLLGNDDAFLIMGRKGYPGSAIEILSTNVIDSDGGGKYVIEQTLKSGHTEGFAISTNIGPASSWDQIYWDWNTQDPVVEESIELKAFATTRQGRDSLVLTTTDKSIVQDISGLDADKYPLMRLEMRATDAVRRTAPQLDNWHVLHVPVPDAVIDPVSIYEFRSDTVGEGADVYIKLGATNVTNIDMTDSLLVKYTLVNSKRERIILDSVRVAKLNANSTISFDYSFNSGDYGLDGESSLIVEINPNFDQLEQHEFNNVYIQPFFVIVDKINPILDITFDGKHIIDGDIVSPTPEILIEVNDENQYAAVDDTSSVQLFLRRGSLANPFERVFMQSNPEINFVPGTLPENKARVFYYPGADYNLEDGQYTLRVQSRDSKGNFSGDNESFYEISFEVVNERGVSQVLNYPNPFSTSTRFVYTLTGGEMPETFQIQIYTLSGKQVKVIDLLEMGEVNVGRNITNYAWDGTDEFGDRLANGVYLYRTVVKMPNGFTERNEGINQYFKNGWGKMYLMR